MFLRGGGDGQMHKCSCSLRGVCIVPGNLNDTTTRLLFTSELGQNRPLFFCRTATPVFLLWDCCSCLVSECGHQLGSKVFTVDLFL